MRNISLIVLFVLPAITAFSQLRYTSHNNYTGNWESGSSWTKAEAWMADPPPSATLSGGQITNVYGYITRNGDLTLNGGTVLNIYDTLVVTGKLTVANEGIVVHPGGLLIVLGDFESTGSGGNKITNNGDIVIVGEFTHWEGNITGGTDFYIYDDTPFVDQWGAPFPNNTEDEEDLYNNDRPLYDFVVGLGVCGGVNTISGSQTLCGSGTPAALVGSTLSNVTYTWQSSTTSATTGFTTAPGVANGKNYSPGVVTQTTWYRRVATGVTCTVTSNVVEVRVFTGSVWTGATNSAWNVATNWCNGIPTSTTDAFIPAGRSNYPNTGFGSVRHLTIEEGASISINTNLNVYGDIESNGTLGFQSTTGGTIAFLGSGIQTVKSSAPLTFSNMTMNASQVVFSTNVNVNRTFTFTAGVINIGNNILTLGTSASGAATNAGTLTYTNGAIVTGPSGGFARYVRNSNHSNMFFPMGTLLYRRPFSFATTVGFDNGGVMTVNYTDANTITQVNIAESPAANGPITWRHDGYWTISHTGMNGGTLTISAGGTGFTVGQTGDVRLLRAASLIPSSTHAAATGTVTDFAARRSGVTLANLTGGAIYVGTINKNQTPLPVELVSFTGQNTDEGILLKWSTSMERNFDHFEIERSSDGIAFDYVSSVTGKGGLAVKTDYHFVDGSARNGKYYYRLKNVDLDDAFDYSRIVVVVAGSGHNLALYPNPVRDKKLSVIIPEQYSMARILINDQLGNAVYQANLSSGEQNIKLADSIGQGFYIAHIILPGEAPKVIKLWIE